MVFLKFENLKKRFKKKEVLKGVEFSVKKGEIFGLIGRSGGGKSVLLKILIGMIKPDCGKIFFEDKNALQNINFLRKKTGFAAQDDMLYTELTIWENAVYFGKLYGMKKDKIKKRFSELINLLELEGAENVFVNYLSGGMKKRANVLVSLIHEPKLLILDEPTIGLDSMLRESLWKYIHKINNEGTTILVTSHLLEEIDKNCNRVGILKNGKIYSLATPVEYREKYGMKKSLGEIFEKLMNVIDKPINKEIKK